MFSVRHRAVAVDNILTAGHYGLLKFTARFARTKSASFKRNFTLQSAYAATQYFSFCRQHLVRKGTACNNRFGIMAAGSWSNRLQFATGLSLRLEVKNWAMEQTMKSISLIGVGSRQEVQRIPPQRQAVTLHAIPFCGQRLCAAGKNAKVQNCFYTVSARQRLQCSFQFFLLV